MLFNIWVTSACNFRCKYCYVPDYEYNMSEKTAKSVVAFIKKNTPKNEKEIIVNFHGGEPLLNFKLIDKIVADLEDQITNKILFGITTNGSLLTKEISEFLATKFQYNLSVSLDGTRSINDKNRVYPNDVGTYDSVIENILYLKSLSSAIRLRMTYNHDTVEHLYESIQHVANLGFTKIVAIPDFSDAQWNDEYINILIKQLNCVFKNFIDNKNIDINIISDDIRRKRQVCHGGINGVNIYIDGNIFPCTWTVGNPDFIIGNIYDGVDVEKVNIILDHSFETIQECKECGLYEACIGNRCRIVNKIITGDYCKVPAMRCEYNNIIYKLQKQYRL